MENRHSEEGHFYGLVAPIGMWRALGATGLTGSGMDGPAAVTWGSHSRNERQEAYVIELIERARDELTRGQVALSHVSHAELVRMAIGLYGRDRLSRALQGLATAFSGPTLRVRLDKLPEPLAAVLGEISEVMLNKRYSG